MIYVSKFARTSMMLKIQPYSPGTTEKLSKLRTAQWCSAARGGPGFTMALDTENCKTLRRMFGDEVVFQEDIIEWGRELKAEQERLTRLATAAHVDDMQLVRLATRLPSLFATLRPDQKVGAHYIAESPNPLIADEPGLGKTLEIIAGVCQAGLDEGPNLIICPKISIENVWLKELAKWQDNAIFPAPEGRRAREKFLEEVEDCLDLEVPLWLIINPAMLTYRKTKEGQGVYDPVTDSWFDSQFPFIHRTPWNCVIIDETQDSGIANASSQLAKSLKTVKTSKRIGASGTPAGGKASRLWGTLHWLEPKVFTSKTRWSEQWLTGRDINNPNSDRDLRIYGGIQAEREAAFYKAHAQYILRRKKDEVFRDAEGNPTFPPPTDESFWVEMTPTQEKQYKLMDSEAMVKLGDLEGSFQQNNLLGAFQWLRQFADARCEMAERGKVYDDELDEFIMKYKAMPTEDSPKLPVIDEFISELDVPNSGERLVIFSQFATMVDMITEYLEKQKLPVGKITGATSRKKREELISGFQEGDGPHIMVMSTRSGGVSINLDRADICIHFDEEWDPDKKIQATGRIHRASRIHFVRSITIRTKGTIEEDVVKKALERKTHINDVLLDVFRDKRGKAVEMS